jgi:hypothetical protein
MKNLKTLVLAAAMLFAGASVMFTSCTKEGPQGPPGANGTDGTDANATCTQCHNFGDSLVAKIVQYDASKHGTGFTFFENRNTCAPCHTSQGFQECLKTGADTTAYAINDPAPTNCRTCHKIHETYSTADFALRTTAPYTLRIDHSKTMDFTADGGSGNLCGRCHQARYTTPWLTNPTSDVDSLKPTSSRWGPHHGPQSLVLGGQGAWEVGVVPFDNSPHRDLAACVTCHGATAQGNLAGGHTLWMTNEEEGITLTAGCKTAGCHPNATSFDIDGKQTEISGMIQTLKVQLANANMLDTNTMLLKTGKKYSQLQLAIFWNFLMVEADRSEGVHNYKYTRDMLQSGIDYYNAKGY